MTHRRTKITRKASDAAENLQYICGRSENNINASCMTISGGRTEQLDLFCRVTGFSSDFLSFIVVELIRIFHGVLGLACHELTSVYVLLATSLKAKTAQVRDRFISAVGHVYA